MQENPVAVVIVPDVRVVEPGHPPFPWRSLVLVVPLLYHHLAVGIGARAHKCYHILTDQLNILGFAAYKRIDEFRNNLGGADFGRVYRACVKCDRRELFGQAHCFRLAEFSRIAQFLTPGLQLFEPGQILGRRDNKEHKRITVCRFSQLPVNNPVRALSKQLVILEPSEVVDYLAFGPHAVPEELLRIRQLLCRQRH